MYRRFCRIIGLAVVLALCTAKPHAAEVVTFAELPGFLESQNTSPVAVALIGSRVDASDRRLTERVKFAGSAVLADEVSKIDTEMAVWLQSVSPRAKVLCVSGRDLVESLVAANEGGATVLCLPWDMLQLFKAHVGLKDAIADSWRRGVLLFTVIPPGIDSHSDSFSKGVLEVRLSRHSCQGEPVTEMSDFIGVPRSLCLSTDLLEDAPSALQAGDYLPAASLYIAALASALPAQSTASHSHLERTARLALSTPLLRDSKSGSLFHLIDATACFEPTTERVLLGDKTVGWNDRFRDLDDEFDVHLARGPSQKLERIQTGVIGETRIRWLLAAAILTNAQPVMVYPDASGIQTILGLETDSTEDVAQLLDTQRHGIITALHYEKR